MQFRFGEELIAVDDTDQIEKEDRVKKIVTQTASYLARKVILACGLLHYPRKLSLLEALKSRKVHYRNPNIGDYEGQRVLVVGGGDSALDAALMVLGRGGQVDMAVRADQPRGKAESIARVTAAGGTIHCGAEITEAGFAGDQISVQLSQGEPLLVDHVIVQIGFLSAKDTFSRLGISLNEDGSIAIDPYYETSRKGIFAAGDVHGDIKLITVAWAEGIQAAIYAFKEITSPYWLNEKRLRDQKLTLIGEKITTAARAGFEAHGASKIKGWPDECRNT